MADTLIASGSLAQVQTHLSLVAGTSFADLQGVNLGLYLGKKLVVWDSAMRPASAYPVAAGTGETYGANLITGWTNRVGTPFDTFVSSGANITSAISSSAGVADTNAFTVVNGALYRSDKTFSLTSGGPTIIWYDIAGNGATVIKTESIGTGSYSTYYTETVGGVSAEVAIASSIVNCAISGIVTHQVLTPSIMGVIVSSNPTGTPGDAWSIAPNFNRNDSSGYTWAILSESSSIMYSFPEDKTQIDRRPRNKAYAEPFVNFQSPGSAPIWLAPVLVDDIRKHTNLKAFSRAYYEPWGRFQPPVSAPRLPLTADVSDKTAHTNRKVPRAYFDFASKAPTQKDGNINPSPQASGRYRGWASNWAIGVKEDFPWS